MLTRNVYTGRTPSGVLLGFIETSTPGLMGQSGGPIFDKDGVVWAIQSHTQTRLSGFEAKVPPGLPDAGQTVHQFLSAGRGTHPATVYGLLSEAGVAHSLSAL
jgi:hypothetical protein